MPGNEYIWGHDFDHRAVASLIASLKLQRYGELAACTREDLLDIGLNDDEDPIVERELAKRGLKLRTIT
jgi:hypothetical protein